MVTFSLGNVLLLGLLDSRLDPERQATVSLSSASSMDPLLDTFQSLSPFDRVLLDDEELEAFLLEASFNSVCFPLGTGISSSGGVYPN